jgi:hypothetical protein
MAEHELLFLLMNEIYFFLVHSDTSSSFNHLKPARDATSARKGKRTHLLRRGESEFWMREEKINFFTSSSFELDLNSLIAENVIHTIRHGHIECYHLFIYYSYQIELIVLIVNNLFKCDSLWLTCLVEIETTCEQHQLSCK